MNNIIVTLNNEIHKVVKVKHNLLDELSSQLDELLSEEYSPDQNILSVIKKADKRKLKCYLDHDEIKSKEKALSFQKGRDNVLVYVQ